MIIQRYIYREILHRLFWIAGLLVLILATNKFVEYLGDAASGKIPASFVWKFLVLKVLAMQTELLPVVLFLSVVLAFSRLNQANELAVMAAAGLGKKSLLKIVLKFTLVFSVLVSVVAFYAAPWAKTRISELKNEAWKISNISGIVSGKFKELSEGKSVVYVQKLSDDDVMQNVFLQIQDKGRNSVLRSSSATFDVDEASGNRFVVFKNGKRYVGKPGALDYQITEYGTYGVLVEADDKQTDLFSVDSLPTSLLLVSKLPRHNAELQWRISSIFICILLAILGVLLNQYPFGQKPFTLLLFGILIYFIYNNLLSISKNLMEKEHISSLPGLWWVHVLLIIIIAIIYKYPDIVHYRNNRKTQIIPAE